LQEGKPGVGEWLEALISLSHFSYTFPSIIKAKHESRSENLREGLGFDLSLVPLHTWGVPGAKLITLQAGARTPLSQI